MSKTVLSSDWHLNHDVEFVWKVRGFSNVKEMNEAIIERHNSVADPEDEVYLLGDICLGGGSEEILAENKALIERANGRIHIILGNHDSPRRVEMYKSCANVVEVVEAKRLEYNKYHFFMTHWPCVTANLEKEALRQCMIGLYGHTHQNDSNFYNGLPFVYHVGVDSHNCYPIVLDDAIEEMKQKVKECKEQL